MTTPDGLPEVVITGANLRIVNGLGSTDCRDEASGTPIPDCPNGLGNLIVGYNEMRLPEVGPPDRRTGSHNIIVGKEQNFSSFGGLVVGFRNEISGDFAAICGGFANTASGALAAVSGGRDSTRPARIRLRGQRREGSKLAGAPAFAAVSGGGLSPIRPMGRCPAAQRGERQHGERRALVGQRGVPKRTAAGAVGLGRREPLRRSVGAAAQTHGTDEGMGQMGGPGASPVPRPTRL